MSVVIVGAGHAGGQLAASLRQATYAKPITLVGSEPQLPYQRPPLSKEYLRGEYGLERVELRPSTFYDQRDIRLKLGQTITDIDRARRVVFAEDGESLEYEHLVLATGSEPIRPQIPGIDLPGVHFLRTVNDVDAIKADIKPGQQVGIIGGGYIGLEVAASLRDLGCSVAVVELEDRVLKRVVPSTLSDYYQQIHEGRGVEFHLNAEVSDLVANSKTGRVSSMRCTDGSEIPAQITIVGVGVKPSTNLAAAADLPTDNGIVVDVRCRTADEHIYAIGDCSNHPNPLLDKRLRLESVPNAMGQARVAASNICGAESIYASYPWFWSDQYELKLQMVGSSNGADDHVMRGDMSQNCFSVFHLKGGQLIGSDSVNSPRDFMAAKLLVGKSVDWSALSDPNMDLRSLVSA